MTTEEAIKILDPATALWAIEYYTGFKGKEAKIAAVEEACRMAVKALKAERRTEMTETKKEFNDSVTAIGESMIDEMLRGSMNAWVCEDQKERENDVKECIHWTICREMHDTYKAKNADYGDSFAIVREKYPNAILIRLNDKLNRLETLITPERGGMITSFTMDGEEFVWTRRPNFSECNRPRFGVPVLFPSCGNPDNGVHIFDGKAYPMETHGFADLCAWEVDSVGPDGVTLALESTPLTKFLYPFDFTLLVNYNLEGNKATISLTVINEGNTDMPFSFGYHPYFTASALENVDFDIRCKTCSENAKGEFLVFCS